MVFLKKTSSNGAEFYSTQKKKFFFEDFFGKCNQIRKFVDLVTSTKEILHTSFF